MKNAFLATLTIIIFIAATPSFAKPIPCGPLKGANYTVNVNETGGSINVELETKNTKDRFSIREHGHAFMCLGSKQLPNDLVAIKIDHGMAGTSAVHHSHKLYVFQVKGDSLKLVFEHTLYKKSYRDKKWITEVNQNYSAKPVGTTQVAINIVEADTGKTDETYLVPETSKQD